MLRESRLFNILSLKGGVILLEGANYKRALIRASKSKKRLVHNILRRIFFSFLWDRLPRNLGQTKSLSLSCLKKCSREYYMNKIWDLDPCRPMLLGHSFLFMPVQSYFKIGWTCLHGSQKCVLLVLPHHSLLVCYQFMEWQWIKLNKLI